MVKKKKPEKHYVTYTFVAAIIFFVLFILSTIFTFRFMYGIPSPSNSLELIGLFATLGWFIVSLVGSALCFGLASDEFDES